MASTHSSWKLRWACMNGPTLYQLPSATQNIFVDYEQSAMEAIPDLFINTLKLIGNFLKWTCIFWVPWFARSLLFTENEFFRCSKYLCCVSLLQVLALALRGTGRFLNPNYRKFITLLNTCESNTSSESDLEQLTHYSFSSPWPAHFDVRDLPSDSLKPYEVPPLRSTELSPILWPLTWLVAQTFGVYLAYPGCLTFTNSMTYPARMEARAELRNQFGIRRAGLRTRFGEFVEILYSDRRGAAQAPRESASAGHGDSKGEILILCCEGNAGYPEIGITPVPLQQGYSVIGWNHPGFSSSTGLPLPHNEQAAVEAVLLFAVHHLHFRLDQIVLFGWSIGGYSVTWAAMNYPEVAGVILDATFDTIDELAKKTLPSALYPIVLATIRGYLDLNNMYQLTRYDGPVRVIRRTYDEIISTGDGTSWSSNRGNHLLVGLLKHRYPHLMTEENEEALWNFLSLNNSGQAILEEVDLKHYDSLVVRQLNAETLGRQSPSASALTTPPVVMPTTNLFPSQLGSQTLDAAVKRGMLLYLVSEHFVEYHSTHCTTLPSELFHLPWSPFTSGLSHVLSTGSAGSRESDDMDGDQQSDDANDPEDIVVVSDEDQSL